MSRVEEGERCRLTEGDEFCSGRYCLGGREGWSERE